MMKKTLNQKQIKEEWFILAYSSRGIESVMARKSWWPAGTLAGVGSWLITFLPTQERDKERGRDREQEVGQGYKLSKSTPSDVLLQQVSTS